MEKHSTQWDTLIVGLGVTGLSVAQFLRDRDVSFAITDSRDNPPGLEELKRCCPDAPVFTGGFREKVFKQARQLIVNPGISVQTSVIQEAIANGAEVIGDIELFARSNQYPVVAITGSNGKTTVTHMLALMAEKAGKSVKMGGNVGIPALQLLAEEPVDLYVLELSSFQLETTWSLQAVSAVILNISEDHMDRYDGLEAYASAKARIYDQCQKPVVNRDDEALMKLIGRGPEKVSFGLNRPTTERDYGLLEIDDAVWLVKGDQPLMAAHELRVKGEHNIANALAALALGELAGLDMQGMLKGLREFPGVRHRSQWVATIDKVNWYNDSKGTNVGATLATLAGMPGQTILIAGGQGKGADFKPLEAVVKAKAKAVILLGEDAKKISEALADYPEQHFVNNLEDAVNLAQSLADANDNVLLSPACASFDMYHNFEARGEAFIQAVRGLL